MSEVEFGASSAAQLSSLEDSDTLVVRRSSLSDPKQRDVLLSVIQSYCQGSLPDDIATNASAIETNETNIATNASAIETNTTNIAANAEDIEGLSLTEDTTVDLDTSMTLTEIQAAIDAIPKNLGGYTLTIQFADGTYSIDSYVVIENFYNGTVDVYGNSSDNSSSASKSVTISMATSGLALFVFQCTAFVKIYYLAFENTIATSNKVLTLITACSYVNVAYCTFTGTSDPYCYGIQAPYTKVHIASCYAQNLAVGILASTVGNISVTATCTFDSCTTDLSAVLGGILAYTGNVSDDGLTTATATGGQVFDTNAFLDLVSDIASAQLPIGFVYRQLSGTDDPDTLGMSGTWEDITDNYAGEFFRAAGGDADSFSSSSITEQGFAMQGHYHEIAVISSVSAGNAYPLSDDGDDTAVAARGTADTVASSRVQDPTTDGTNGTPVTDSETRPVNSAITIWQKTALT